jgi:hypothetical protein
MFSLSLSKLRQDLASKNIIAADLATDAGKVLFSSAHLFVSEEDAAEIEALAKAVEAVVVQPAWERFVLGDKTRKSKCRGAFVAFDFHVGGPDGPKLIEVNSNAGGGLLNALLRDAQDPCCDEVKPWLQAGGTGAALAREFVDMFRKEFELERGEDIELRRIAVADDNPSSQFLYPEFLLFKSVFESVGVECDVVDASDFTWNGVSLIYRGDAVDLVYNRTTDFTLSEPSHTALKQAWDAGAVVVTPNPDHHALYADKRNLAFLRDPGQIPNLVLSEEQRAVLRRAIPCTVTVDASQADELWATRKQWFFKPSGGFGSKAAYRGDKMTRKVWENILSAGIGAYVAQEIVDPCERAVVLAGGGCTKLKADLRAYSYAGRVQLLAARLYQGQTTNFRTPGGGFAPVHVVNGQVINEMRERRDLEAIAE